MNCILQYDAVIIVVDNDMQLKYLLSMCVCVCACVCIRVCVWSVFHVNSVCYAWKRHLS